jgi:hypothetical protein
MRFHILVFLFAMAVVVVILSITGRPPAPLTPAEKAAQSAQQWVKSIADLKSRALGCIETAKTKAIDAGIENKYGSHAVGNYALKQCGAIIKTYLEAPSTPPYTGAVKTGAATKGSK